MDIYWCGSKVSGVISSNQGTWQNFSRVQAANGSTCVLKFVSTVSGNQGVVPSNVQVGYFRNQNLFVSLRRLCVKVWYTRSTNDR